MCGAWPCVTQRRATVRDEHPLLVLSVRVRNADIVGGFERKHCSASLLDDQRTVLTSAHCLDDDVTAFDTVEVVYQIDGVTQWRVRAKSFRIHRLWDISEESNWPTADIALVELATQVETPQGARVAHDLTADPIEIWGAQFGEGLSGPTLYRCAPARDEFTVLRAGSGVSVTADCGLRPGASGGPFLQMRAGEQVVVGVLSRYNNIGQNLSTSMDALADIEANFTKAQQIG
jgi:hypothetical protein